MFNSHSSLETIKKMSTPIPNPANTESASDELAMQAIRLASTVVLPMTLKSAIELNIIKVLSKASPDVFLSPSQIAVEIGATQNPNAPALLDRMLNLLASYSILKCRGETREDGSAERVYGVSPICEFLTEDEDGGSFAPLLLLHHDEVYMKTWYHLNDVIMKGGLPFDREYGMNLFEYTRTDQRFNQAFNKAMSSHTTLLMKKMLDVYKGFQEGVKVLVDVGGGAGAALGMITAKYPTIKGINFDLPHVIAAAPSYPGVEHIGGDMFAEIPKGDAIFMKWILHDWSDEHCKKLLKNCNEALPAGSGKVIIMESILPQVPDTSLATNITSEFDIIMMALTPGGEERRLNDYDGLARGAGFSECRVICDVYNSRIIEFTK